MTNNVHAVGAAMAQLFRGFAAVLGTGDLAEQFIRSSSFFLLRMKGSEQFASYPLRAMCIFLDKVCMISNSKLLSKSQLDLLCKCFFVFLH
jgi:hypothetical protein